MAGKKGQKKRFWSEDEKRSICAQTVVPGVSIAPGCSAVFDECQPNPHMVEGSAGCSKPMRDPDVLPS